MDAHISPDATLPTDGHTSYAIISERKWIGKHRVIDLDRSYAWGDVHTNTIENAFSLLKRGIYGAFHKVSIKHWARYCNEFSYRFNHREEQLQMFGMAVKNLVQGEVLSYKKLTAKP